MKISPIILMTLLVAISGPGTSTYAQPGCGSSYVCGKSCADFYCSVEADADVMCIQIPDGCVSGSNANCCPP